MVRENIDNMRKRVKTNKIASNESMFFGAFIYFLVAFLLLLVTFIRVIPA